MPLDDLLVVATNLAIALTQEEDLPPRLRLKSKGTRKHDLDSKSEVKFRQCIDAWQSTISDMSRHFDHDQFWRLVQLRPIKTSSSLVENEDFVALVDYLEKNRQKLGDAELGCTAMLVTTIQRLIESQLKSNFVFAAIDVETTGLNPRGYDRVIEIGIVLMNESGKFVDEYESLINPHRDMGLVELHRIRSADVVRAPSFADIAGDVVQLLSRANMLVGHQIDFDMRFLKHEFGLIGVTLPEVPTFCTYLYGGRSSLAATCKDFGVNFEGKEHHALSDAKAAARIVASVLNEVPMADNASRTVDWPNVKPKNTIAITRSFVETEATKEPSFLSRIGERMHHSSETNSQDALSYLALIDRVLQDRFIDKAEEDLLVDASNAWGLNLDTVRSLHRQYLNAVLAYALADGKVSDSERRDLHAVAKLLGLHDENLDGFISDCESKISRAINTVGELTDQKEMAGKTVCFTGELLSKLNGESITREIAESLAMRAGLKVAPRVTKLVDILVIADPNSQSRKAKQARDYKIQILSEDVFWKKAGIKVD